jgi:hypothetical protein
MLSKQLSFFLIVQSVSAAVKLRALQSKHDDNEQPSSSVMMFSSWADNHDKEYASEEEAMNRLKIWIDNHGMTTRKNLFFDDVSNARGDGRSYFATDIEHRYRFCVVITSLFCAIFVKGTNSEISHPIPLCFDRSLSRAHRRP